MHVVDAGLIPDEADTLEEGTCPLQYTLAWRTVEQRSLRLRIPDPQVTRMMKPSYQACCTQYPEYGKEVQLLRLLTGRLSYCYSSWCWGREERGWAQGRETKQEVGAESRKCQLSKGQGWVFTVRHHWNPEPLAVAERELRPHSPWTICWFIMAFFFYRIVEFTWCWFLMYNEVNQLYLHTSPPSWPPFHHGPIPPSGHHRALIEQIPKFSAASPLAIYFTRDSKRMHSLWGLSFHPTSPFCPPMSMFVFCICILFCLENRLNSSTNFLGSIQLTDIVFFQTYLPPEQTLGFSHISTNGLLSFFFFSFYCWVMSIVLCTTAFCIPFFCQWMHI